MDITELVKNIIGGLKHHKSKFYAGGDKSQKKAAYDKFMHEIERLNKVYKAHQTTQKASDRIKEILISGIKDANAMKSELDGMQDAPKSHHRSGGNNTNNSSSFTVQK